MPRKQRKHAEPVKRVIDTQSKQLVGWLYQWNTGHFAVLWLGEKRTDVEYV